MGRGEREGIRGSIWGQDVQGVVNKFFMNVKDYPNSVIVFCMKSISQINISYVELQVLSLIWNKISSIIGGTANSYRHSYGKYQLSLLIGKKILIDT